MLKEPVALVELVALGPGPVQGPELGLEVAQEPG